MKFALFCLALVLLSQQLWAFKEIDDEYLLAELEEEEEDLRFGRRVATKAAKSGWKKSAKAVGGKLFETGVSKGISSTIKATDNSKEIEKLQDSCYIDSYGRGAGYPLTDCLPGEHKSGALCYPKCKAGYTGVAFVCWQNCPPGFHDIGAFCQKPAPYGRGAGYAIWSKGKCNRNNRQGCEKWGLMWYPRCRAGYHNVGCCICSPNCQYGMRDTGTGCTKHSYTRGAGHILRCRPGLEQSGLLCYPKCKSGYKGVGPVCWGQCPAGLTPCGVFCLNGQSCTSKILSIVQGVVETALDVASFIPGAQGLKGVKAASKAAKAATKAGKFAKKAIKIGKKIGEKAFDVGVSVAESAAFGGTSPKDIANSVLDALIPGYGLVNEFVMRKCKY